MMEDIKKRWIYREARRIYRKTNISWPYALERAKARWNFGYQWRLPGF